MVHEITTSRKVNGDYAILNRGVQIGYASNRNSRHVYFVFLYGIYFGINDVPSRRGGSPGGSVKRLKDVPDYVASVLDTIAIVDEKKEAELKALFSDLVTVDPCDASGAVLSYLVALATDQKMSIDYRNHYVVTVNNSLFNPETDKAFIFKLLSVDVDSTQRLSEKEFFASVDSRLAYGETIELAILRAFTSSKCGGKHGNSARVPRCLLNL